jgi:hypothetical protein
MHQLNFKLSVLSDKGTLSVKWSDTKNLAKYASIQSGRYLKNNTNIIDLHRQYFEDWNQMFWTQRQNMGAFNLPNGATILDIGAGASVVDLLLYSYIPDSKFYLLDKDEWGIKFLDNNLPTVCFSESYPFYNSWDVVKDAIITSGFDSSRFEFLNPCSSFPEQVDAVTSYFSWCFHYPKELYWNKVMQSLKYGGKLILDVRLLADKNVIEEISEQLGSNPVTIPFPKLPNYVDSYPTVVEGISGYRCMWEKKRYD